MTKTASEGERVIAVAGRRGLSGKDVSSAESGLTFYGLAGFLDPSGKEAVNAAGEARHAGTRTVMITGDSADTADGDVK